MGRVCAILFYDKLKIDLVCVLLCCSCVQTGEVDSIMKGTLICAMLLGVRKRGEKQSKTKHPVVQRLGYMTFTHEIRVRFPAGEPSLVVQWLGYMTLTHEIRVQFPARDPCFGSHSLLYSKPRGSRSRHLHLTHDTVSVL